MIVFTELVTDIEDDVTDVAPVKVAVNVKVPDERMLSELKVDTPEIESTDKVPDVPVPDVIPTAFKAKAIE